MYEDEPRVLYVSPLSPWRGTVGKCDCCWPWCLPLTFNCVQVTGTLSSCCPKMCIKRPFLAPLRFPNVRYIEELNHSPSLLCKFFFGSDHVWSCPVKVFKGFVYPWCLVNFLVLLCNAVKQTTDTAIWRQALQLKTRKYITMHSKIKVCFPSTKESFVWMRWQRGITI